MIRSLFSKRHRLNRRLMDEVGRNAIALSPPRIEEVRRLLDAGGDVNYSDGQQCILGKAVRSPWCSADVVRLLLERGANVNGTQRRGLIPPLVLACHHSDNARLRLLVDAGADLNAIDQWSERMALTELTPWADAELVEYFLLHGADPNLGNWRYGYKPLHMAALCGRADLTELYIRYGADVRARDEKGFTPLDLAENRGVDQRATWSPTESLHSIIRILRAAGGDTDRFSAPPIAAPIPSETRSITEHKERFH